MSQLDNWNAEVEYFPEEVVIDMDGNTRTQPSSVGIPLKVTLQPQGQSGTAARRAEQDREGFESEEVMRMRLRRRDDNKYHIQAQSRIRWNGDWWSVFGDRKPYMGSERTRHNIYMLRRS